MLSYVEYFPSIKFNYGNSFLFRLIFIPLGLTSEFLWTLHIHDWYLNIYSQFCIFVLPLVPFNLSLSFRMSLLFGRPPVGSVWPNYEVVVFQHRTGTARKLVSVDNVMSKLNPTSPFSTFFWIFHFPSPSVSLLLD